MLCSLVVYMIMYAIAESCYVYCRFTLDFLFWRKKAPRDPTTQFGSGDNILIPVAIVMPLLYVFTCRRYLLLVDLEAIVQSRMQFYISQ